MTQLKQWPLCKDSKEVVIIVKDKKNTEWKLPKKTFKNHKEIEINTALVIVYHNSFGVLIEFKDLEDDDNMKVSYQRSYEQNTKNKVISNMISKIETKDKLHKVKMMTTQALEAILNKLVKDQVEE